MLGACKLPLAVKRVNFYHEKKESAKNYSSILNKWCHDKGRLDVSDCGSDFSQEQELAGKRGVVEVLCAVLREKVK